MLFANPISVSTTIDFHQLHQIAEIGIHYIELQLPNNHYTDEELREFVHIGKLIPTSFRMPAKMGLGNSAFSINHWNDWLHTIEQIANTKRTKVICHGSLIPLGAFFEYLNARPSDFNALDEFKIQYIERITSQLLQIEKLASPLGIQLLLENAPMGNDFFFEPGHSNLYPALRTPRHLLKIAATTSTKLCFDTANARISSNVLSYMHRSRSIFAGATEKEILNSTPSWIDFYQQIKSDIEMIRLSYAVSWGDTKETTHNSFPSLAYAELLTFAEQVDPHIPITLAISSSVELKKMVKLLYDLKRT